MKSFIACLVLTAAAAAPAVAAEDDAEAHSGPQSSVAGMPLTDGEVRRVDKENGRITVRHGPLAHLEMPAMTMVFRVKDPALLDKIKVGDKIRFRAEKQQGALVITEVAQAGAP